MSNTPLSKPDFQTVIFCWHPAESGHWQCDCGENFTSNARAIIHKSEHRRHKIYWRCDVCGTLLTPSTPAISVVAQPATKLIAVVERAAAASS